MESCPKCEERFEKIGMHWRYNNAHRPSLTKRQENMLEGLLLGDADIFNRKHNPQIRLRMTNKKFMKWISSEFGALSTNVRLESTSKQISNRSNGAVGSIDSENCKDIFAVTFRTTEVADKLSDWYSDGTKRIPLDYEIDKNSLKMWYVCDGYYDNNSDRVAIVSVNESDNLEELSRIVSVNGFSFTPERNSIRIHSNDGVERFFNFIGEAPPGFDYKWGV